MFKKLLVLILIFHLKANAQLLDSLSLDTVQTFTSIEEALKNPEKVYKLKLRRQKLTAFPLADLLKFPNLQYLDLSRNNIEEIDQGIAFLSKLQYLDVSNNELISIPHQIAELKHLKKLILNRNNIVILPPRMAELESLEYLDLYSNELSDIPVEFSDFKRLRTLDLRVILFNDDKQKEIQSLMPRTRIFFSPGCNCGK